MSSAWERRLGMCSMSPGRVTSSSSGQRTELTPMTCDPITERQAYLFSGDSPRRPRRCAWRTIPGPIGLHGKVEGGHDGRRLRVVQEPWRIPPQLRLAPMGAPH
jgi:hypothetical protein